MTEKKKRIIIIGAGPAGLAAAWKLTANAEQNHEVIVLEAADTVGGMAKTICRNENYMDVGGHRFSSKEKQVLDWWKNVMSRQEKDLSAFMLRERVTSIYYKNRFFDYPVTFNLENIKKLGIKTSSRIALDYFKACWHPLEESSLENFYVNRFGKTLYSIFFEEYTEKLCGVHPTKISPKWGEQRVRGLSIGAILRQCGNEKEQQTRDGLLSASLFYYPKYGPGQLWEAVASECEKQGIKFFLNHQVVGLHKNNTEQIDYVKVKTMTGTEKIEGDIFISTMPLRELVTGMNQLPPHIAEIGKKLSYRALVSVGLVVDRTVEIKDCWIYVQDVRVKTGRIQFYDNWSPYLCEHENGKKLIALEYFCEEGDSFWSMSEESCCKLAVSEAITLGIIDETAQIFECYRERIEKAYPNYYGAYEELGTVTEYLDGLKNLFCIGRNGRHEYWNMDRCVLSAWEAVEKCCYCSLSS